MISKLDQIRALREQRFNRWETAREASEREARARNFDPVQTLSPAPVLGPSGKEAAVTVAPRPAAPKRGRCLDIDRPNSEQAREPWNAQGISRRTYYRRKKIWN